MDDLIILLIRGLIYLFRGDPNKQRPAPPSTMQRPQNAPATGSPNAMIPPPSAQHSSAVKRVPLPGMRDRPGARKSQSAARTFQTPIHRLAPNVPRQQNATQRMAAMQQTVGGRAKLAQMKATKAADDVAHRPGSLAAEATSPAAVAEKKRTAAAAAAARPATITAPAIRQLMLSRVSALRTIYVLSEVVGPPVGLRE
jgi:hypothetical protein